MYQQQRRGRRQQHGFEYLPWVHDAGVQAAGRDGVQAEESILAVQVNGPEVLSGFPTEEVQETDDVGR